MEKSGEERGKRNHAMFVMDHAGGQGGRGAAGEVTSVLANGLANLWGN